MRSKYSIYCSSICQTNAEDKAAFANALAISAEAWNGNRGFWSADGTLMKVFSVRRAGTLSILKSVLSLLVCRAIIPQKPSCTRLNGSL